MCGVFGILLHSGTATPAEERLRASAQRLQHRGPDGVGIHAKPGVGLVHTRLSLVDLNERSNQPFWDDTGRYALVYNGELYDYAELRAELEQRGARFHTTSDTEVLLAALLQLGVEQTLTRIEGMFAFALYDSREQSFVVARDRFGIKPLYVHSSPEVFIFSSTVGAMAPWITLKPNASIVAAYMHGFNGASAGPSFYDGVEFVPPGSVIRVKCGGEVQFSSYFTLKDLVDHNLAESLAGMPEQRVVEMVEQGLLGAVNSQLIADAPVGAFCSGGVDSSLLMAMAAKSHRDLQVFHADIEGRLSERDAAEELSRHLKLDLRVVPVRDHHFLDTMPAVAEHFEFPNFVHPTSIPVMLVSQLVAQHGVKAVLTGEGSDECYLGYSWLAPNIRDSIRRLPKRVTGKLRSMVSKPRPVSSGNADRDLAQGLLTGFERELGPAAYRENELDRVAPGPGDSFALGGELSYILRLLLHRNDAMGMSASIEARFPFLDSRLVRLAANLPYQYKIRFSRTSRDKDHPFYRDKWIIRTIADRYVPISLSQRPKHAFRTSAFQRMDIADALFENSFVQDFFGLSRPRLRYMLGKASYTFRFRLLHLDVWGQRCIRGESADSVSRRLATHVKIRNPE